MPDLEIIRPRQMTRWARLKDTVRGITLGPWNPKDRAIARYFGGGSSTLSGVSVTEDTAMTVSAVWSAVTMISDDIASLPLMLYKRLPNGGKDRTGSMSCCTTRRILRWIRWSCGARCRPMR